jgi:L-2-hydroxyglutarate oxidase LhgO
MSDSLEVTVVGAGVIGTAVAHVLARQGREVFVIEKNPGVTQGENQSSRNSGVIHAGLYYDQATRPSKAKLCAAGNKLIYEFCRRFDLPHKACGKLVVATKQEDLPAMERYQARAAENGVPCEKLSGNEAREREPLVNALAALWLPTSGIIDPTAFLHQLYALASSDGAQFLTHTEVIAARPEPEGIRVTLRYRDGATDEFLTQRLINCAGLYSDEIARLVNPDSPYLIDPMRGEAACFYRNKRPELAMGDLNIYPTPYQVQMPGGTYWTVGVHLTPTLETLPDGMVHTGSTVTVGPLNIAAHDKEHYGGEYRPMAEFHGRVAGFFPGLKVEDLQPYQAGIQARLAGHQDWVMEYDPKHPACLNLLGFDSPGLTGSLAIAEEVKEKLSLPL